MPSMKLSGHWSVSMDESTSSRSWGLCACKPQAESHYASSKESLGAIPWSHGAACNAAIRLEDNGRLQSSPAATHIRRPAMF
mmetsp:Transcript_15238/g.32877  ORF Transcript_15238/g.32877 Transcript_15238/m.32877 type:complete len:82 (+) Transcript_15238:652-897(+)